MVNPYTERVHVTDRPELPVLIGHSKPVSRGLSSSGGKQTRNAQRVRTDPVAQGCVVGTEHTGVGGDNPVARDYWSCHWFIIVIAIDRHWCLVTL